MIQATAPYPKGSAAFLMFGLWASACAAPNENKGSGTVDSGPAVDDGSADGGADGAADGGTDGGNDGGEPTPCTIPDPDPGLNAEGHPADGWNWERRGLLWEDREVWEETEGEINPTPVEWNGEYLLIFVRMSYDGVGLFVSRSTDTLTWSTPVSIEGLEGLPNDRPGLSVHDGQLRLFHGSNPIHWSLSNDGVTFEYQGEALARGLEGGFDDHTVFYPNPVAEAGSLALYYTAFDGEQFSLGRSQSDDGGTTWSVGEQVLAPVPGSWEQSGVAMPQVAYLDGVRLTWYGGQDRSMSATSSWRIGMERGGQRAVSLPLIPSSTESVWVQDPAVIPFEDGWLMVYVGTGEDRVSRLHVATSRVCNE